MEPDLSKLDDYLDSAGVDGYLVDADGEDSDQRYLSGFTAPDPFVTLYAGEVHLLVSGLEYGRARKDSRAATVERHAEYDFRAKTEEYGRTGALNRVVVEFLDAHDVETVATPSRFPLARADRLRELGTGVTADEDGIVTEIRATKTETEIDYIERAQRANERALRAAETLLRAASTTDDGVRAGENGKLYLDGEVLTSERVKEEIEVTLLRDRCGLDEAIVACGADAADPHDRGSGPLRANEPIIVDVFPREKATGYHADMTRTFCVGEPSDTLREWHDLTCEAVDAARDAIEPGVTGSAVHDAACDVYEDAGLATLRSDERTEVGFIHSTGHGVGLDIHEQPGLNSTGEELRPGHVVTVEPGLYDPDVGGVRVEDLVVVREDGCETLTDYHRELVL